MADHEGVHGHQVAHAVGFYVPLTKFRTEALQKLHLSITQFDLLLADCFLKPQRTLAAGQEVVARPHAPEATGADLDALEHQFLCHAQAAVGGILQAVLQYGLFDLLGHPIGVRTSSARQPIYQALGPVGLVVTPNLVELLPGIAHDAAGTANVFHLGREI